MRTRVLVRRIALHVAHDVTPDAATLYTTPDVTPDITTSWTTPDVHHGAGSGAVVVVAQATRRCIGVARGCATAMDAITPR